MNLSVDFTAFIEQKLFQRFGSTLKIETIQSVRGGSINQSFKLVGKDQSFFLKINDSQAYPGMFDAEYKGLELLREHTDLNIPEVLIVGEKEETAFLIMQFIETGSPNINFWEVFGQSLANLHRNTHDRFGLDHSNYIGSLPQQNNFCNSWSEFFITQRIEPMVKLATDQKKWDSGLNRSVSILFNRLEDIFPTEPPALLHGDLWSGNFGTDLNGEPMIFDPAVYYGHREMDIAMTQLFGGFESEFYEAYHASYPLEQGWENRVNIANMYPLLVHVNLFGDSYLSGVKSVLKEFA